MHQTKFFNLLKLFFNVAISKSFGNFGIPELKPSTPLFSYQYLSPSFRSNDAGKQRTHTSAILWNFGYPTGVYIDILNVTASERFNVFKVSLEKFT